MASRTMRDLPRRLNDSVTCPICLLVFDQPKSLLCGHTFCLNCITGVSQLIDSDESDDERADIVALCPLCRNPFQMSVRGMPANVVAQNVIDELLRSEGLCRACCRNRSLELATKRCQDCDETLCNSCSAQHTQNTKPIHNVTSIACDKHEQNLTLHCVDCRTNICFGCFSETHGGHECREINKMAAELVDMLKKGVEQLCSRETDLETDLATVATQKEKYEKQSSELKQGLGGGVPEQPPRAADAETPGDLENLIETKLKDTNATLQRRAGGETTDNSQVRGLVQDVIILLDGLIIKHSIRAERLQVDRSDVEMLKTRANAILCNRSSSTYWMTENAASILRLEEEIKTLLRRTDASNGAVPILSSEGYAKLDELLKQVAVLKSSATGDRGAGNSPVIPPPVAPKPRQLQRRQQRPQQQQQLVNELERRFLELAARRNADGQNQDQANVDR